MEGWRMEEGGREGGRKGKGEMTKPGGHSCKKVCQQKICNM